MGAFKMNVKEQMVGISGSFLTQESHKCLCPLLVSLINILISSNCSIWQAWASCWHSFFAALTGFTVAFRDKLYSLSLFSALTCPFRLEEMFVLDTIRRGLHMITSEVLSWGGFDVLWYERFRQWLFVRLSLGVCYRGVVRNFSL